MKWLLIVVLVCSVLISGCSSNKTGYECFCCEEQVSGEARTCPHCGQPFDFKAPTFLTPAFGQSDTVQQIDVIEAGPPTEIEVGEPMEAYPPEPAAEPEEAAEPEPDVLEIRVPCL